METTKYAVVDQDGRATGFYSSDIHSELPEGAFEISHEVWADWIVDNGRKRWVDGTLVVLEEPEVPVQPTVIRTLKSDIWRRCTDEEAALLDAALDAAPARLRRLFNDSQVIESDKPEYQFLLQGIGAAVGAERALELLAASQF